MNEIVSIYHTGKPILFLGIKRKIRERWRKVKKSKQIKKKKKESLEPSCEDTDLSQSSAVTLWRISETSEKPRAIYHGLFLFQHDSEGSGTKFSFIQQIFMQSLLRARCRAKGSR